MPKSPIRQLSIHQVGVDERILSEKADEEVIEVMNGCICCTVRGDLVVALKKLHSKVSLFDAIIIETTGLADQHRQSAAPSSSPCPGRLGRTASDKGYSTYSGGTHEPYRPPVAARRAAFSACDSRQCHRL